MTTRDIEALDRRLDALRHGSFGTEVRGDDLVSLLAQVSSVEWPDRAAGERVAARVAAVLGMGVADGGAAGSPLLAGVQGVPSVPGLPGALSAASVAVIRAHPPGRARFRSRRPAVAVSALLAAAATVMGILLVTSPAAAPPFQSGFSAALLAPARPGAAVPGRHEPGRWQVASYITAAGWRAGHLSLTIHSLSCPAVATCYATAARPNSIQSQPGNFNILEVSADGGATWTTLGLPSDISVTTPLQCPQAPATCVAAGYDAGTVALLRTTDGGRMWSARPIRRAVFADQLACMTSLVCTGIFQTGSHPPVSGADWAADPYRVLVTRDGGRTWRPGQSARAGTGLPGLCRTHLHAVRSADHHG